MANLVNLKTNDIENVPESAVTDGTHAYPLVDQNGFASIASSPQEYQQLKQNGYSDLSPEQIQAGLQYGKYDTPGQTIAAGAEGAARSATFGLSTKLETALGVPGADIMARQHYHPIASTAGEVAGLFIPGTAGSLLGKAGSAVADAVEGAAGAGLGGRIATLAAKNAVQTAALQGGQELSNMFAGDPNQTAESAIAHIGLAGTLGGAGGAVLGTVPAIWKGAGRVMTALTDAKNQMTAASPEGVQAVMGMAEHEAGGLLQSGLTMAGHAAGLGPLASLASGFISKQVLANLPKIVNKISGAMQGVSPEAIMNGIDTAVRSGAPVDAIGFHAMTSYFDHAQSAQMLMDKGIQKFFDPDAEPISQFQISGKDNDKLEKALESYRTQPAQMMGLGGNIGNYLPEHQSAVAQVATRAMQYLDQVKPQTEPAGVLDSDQIPSHTDDSQYQRTLGLVQNPLSIFETMRVGNLTDHDMAVMQGVYPALYKSLQAKIFDKLAEVKGKGDIIPYQKRLVLSQFMGQNLDSTIGPMTMMTLRPPQPQGQPGPRGQPPHARSPGKSGKSQTAMLGKIKQTPQNEMTMTQRAEQDRTLQQ